MPVAEALKIACRSCGVDRRLEDFRPFKADPPSYMDFCVFCERRESTITLYRRFSAHATKEIAEAVFAAERAPEGRRSEEQKALLVTPQQKAAPKTNEGVIQRELARRELARRRLLFFMMLFHPDYKPGWVHQDMARRLEQFVEDVVAGKSPRLMIAMPPRHGKSQEASIDLVAWLLGNHPELGVIGASYAQSLPIEFSRQIRDMLEDPEYQALFPETRLRADSKAVESWKTTKGGGYIAAGVGVGINGKGMHIGVADDLIKDAEAAQSETIRTNTYAWYQTVFRTRLAPGGGILLIGTRWHDADVQGQELTKEEMLRKQGIPEAELENWDVIRYPAIAEQDEWLLKSGEIHVGVPLDGEIEPRLLRKKGGALHPERYPINELMKLKHSMPSQQWSALYQQNPTPDDGDFFKSCDLIDRRLQPEYWANARRFVVFDLAISQRTAKRDFTVGGVFALTSDDSLYLLEVVRGRWNTMQIVNNAVDLILRYDPEVFAGERGQIYEAVWPLIRKELEKHRKYVNFDESLVPINDKEVRARPLQGRTQVHKFFFSFEGDRPDGYNDVRKELLRFPNGTHDDCVDMCAWGARLALNMSLPGDLNVAKPFPSWKDRYKKGGRAGASHMSS